MKVHDAPILREHLTGIGSAPIMELCRVLGVTIEELGSLEFEALREKADETLRARVRETLLFDDESKEAEETIRVTCSMKIWGFFRRARKDKVAQDWSQDEKLHKLFATFNLIRGDIHKFRHEVMRRLPAET